MREQEKVYPEREQKSSEKKLTAAQKTARTKKIRREKALEGVTLEQVLRHLGLEDEGGTRCPCCKERNCLLLKREEHFFRCRSCDKRGNSIRMVKEIRDISDSEAIAYRTISLANWLRKRSQFLVAINLPSQNISRKHNQRK